MKNNKHQCNFTKYNLLSFPTTEVFEELIDLMEDIRKVKGKLEEMRNKIPQSVLSNFDYIEDIYNFYRQKVDEIPDLAIKQNEIKKIFSLIIYLLYAPEVLAGGKAPAKLRSSITSVLHCSGSFISNNVPIVVSNFITYETDRRIIYYLCYEVFNWLKTSGKAT